VAGLDFIRGRLGMQQAPGGEIHALDSIRFAVGADAAADRIIDFMEDLVVVILLVRIPRGHGFNLF
jgi:hypothetical protein